MVCVRAVYLSTSYVFCLVLLLLLLSFAIYSAFYTQLSSEQANTHRIFTVLWSNSVIFTMWCEQNVAKRSRRTMTGWQRLKAARRRSLTSTTTTKRINRKSQACTCTRKGSKAHTLARARALGRDDVRKRNEREWKKRSKSHVRIHVVRLWDEQQKNTNEQRCKLTRELAVCSSR